MEKQPFRRIALPGCHQRGDGLERHARQKTATFHVIPAQAGTQSIDATHAYWIPACAGMTNSYSQLLSATAWKGRPTVVQVLSGSTVAAATSAAGFAAATAFGNGRVDHWLQLDAFQSVMSRDFRDQRAGIRV